MEKERARLCVYGKKNVITLPHIWEDKTCTYDNHTVNLTEGQVNSTVDLVTLYMIFSKTRTVILKEGVDFLCHSWHL